MVTPKMALPHAGCLVAIAAVVVVVIGTCSAAEEPEGGAPGGGFAGLGDFSKLGGDGLNGMFKSMTDGGGAALTDFMSNFGGTKLLSGVGASDKRESGGKELGVGGAGGFMGMKDPMDFFKLMLNPMEFMTRLAKEFKLDRGELTQAVGRGMNFGLETALQPPMVCIKIIEKVFVPDVCKLKFVCDMGHQMAMFKGQMPKFPDSYFEGASTAKALYDGASGRECEHVYVCTGDGPKLKKEYAGLKQGGGHAGNEHSDNQEYAASQQSRVVVKAARGAAARSS